MYQLPGKNGEPRGASILKDRALQEGSLAPSSGGIEPVGGSSDLPTSSAQGSGPRGSSEGVENTSHKDPQAPGWGRKEEDPFGSERASGTVVLAPRQPRRKFGASGASDRWNSIMEEQPNNQASGTL